MIAKVPGPERLPAYLEEIQRILCGISLSVPMTTILEFIYQNRTSLRNRGWEVPRF